jgi:hypothetical protein
MLMISEKLAGPQLSFGNIFGPSSCAHCQTVLSFTLQQTNIGPVCYFITQGSIVGVPPSQAASLGVSGELHIAVMVSAQAEHHGDIVPSQAPIAR